jgi:hypothetical protein
MSADLIGQAPRCGLAHPIVRDLNCEHRMDLVHDGPFFRV